MHEMPHGLNAPSSFLPGWMSKRSSEEGEFCLSSSREKKVSLFSFRQILSRVCAISLMSGEG